MELILLIRITIYYSKLVGSLLALDDMVDSSETRRKQPCWYKLEDVGLQAINDCLMIENAVYFLVDKYFSDTDYHMKLLELYREATFATSIGQVLDYQASRENVTTFTMDKYKAICRTKSSYGTFSLPVFMAMFMCGITDPQAYKETDDILFEICYYFQTQNDFEDCYGDPKATGRVGTDIEDNRCTWMSVIAVEKANEEQKRILQESYGQRDPEKAAKVRQVYNELGMVNLFATYEEDSYNYIKNMINIKSRSLKPDMFLRIWEQFYRKIAVKQ
ncbi:unnamed protein product [Hermetia illucens]|uniref:Farnesyl pyrophosphate synthase n=1 Tax=Hermetia illucens TaxID=343691 RepID=A0A7R8UB55_HERIL|nr:unnamed protein product [Hermetia illucens]